MAEHLILELNSTSGESKVSVDVNTESASIPPKRFPGRVPFFIPRDQAYYWTREWQQGEAEADEELRRGEARTFEGIEDALRWLDDQED